LYSTVIINGVNTTAARSAIKMNIGAMKDRKNNTDEETS